MSSKFFVLGCLTALFTLSALGFTVYHSSPHCSYTTDSSSSKTCSQETIDSCPPAYKVYTLENESGSISESTVTCPWRNGTSILGFASLGLVQLFLIIFMLRMKKNALKVPLAILALMVIGSLIATMVLMIIDLSDGHKSSDSKDDSESYRPGLYIANTALVFSGTLMVAVMAILGWKLTVEPAKEVNKETVKIPQIATLPAQPPTAETSRTSRSGMSSQSIFMINGYSGLNSDWLSRSTAKMSNPYAVR